MRMLDRTGTDLTFRLRKLVLADTPDVFALHRRVRLASVFGALDPRSPREFAKLLADKRAAAVGAHIGGRLVGYAISVVPDEPSAPSLRFLARFGAEGEGCAESRGIGVAPEHQKNGIGAAMIRFQRSLMEADGIAHAFNIVLLRNEIGVIARLAGGAAMVDHVADRNDDICFLAYTGPLRGSFDPSAACAVPLAAECEQRRLFSLGHAVMTCERGGAAHEAGVTLVFSPERRPA
jgi:ribosomal protein S18 acetylase RimI-like enzyme